MKPPGWTNRKQRRCQIIGGTRFIEQILHYLLQPRTMHDNLNNHPSGSLCLCMLVNLIKNSKFKFYLDIVGPITSGAAPGARLYSATWQQQRASSQQQSLYCWWSRLLLQAERQDADWRVPSVLIPVCSAQANAATICSRS